VGLLAAGCSSGGAADNGSADNTAEAAASASASPSAAPSPSPSPRPYPDSLPGMPPVTDAHNVHAEAGANMMSDAVADAKPLVYVPHNNSSDVWVIDQNTYEVVGKYQLSGELQHVVPSWDMQTLYATDDTGNHLTS